MNAAEFNALYEVGVPVFAYPGARPEDIPSTRRLATRTRSAAQPVGSDRRGVVWVDGHGACIALTHVDVVPEDEWEKAHATEALSATAATRDASTETLAPWLYQRFNPLAPPWESLSDADRSKWEHEASAVRRAVARGGFKAEAAAS